MYTHASPRYRPRRLCEILELENARSADAAAHYWRSSAAARARGPAGMAACVLLAAKNYEIDLHAAAVGGVVPPGRAATASASFCLPVSPSLSLPLSPSLFLSPAFSLSGGPGCRACGCQRHDCSSLRLPVPLAYLSLCACLNF